MFEIITRFSACPELVSCAKMYHDCTVCNNLLAILYM